MSMWFDQVAGVLNNQVMIIINYYTSNGVDPLVQHCLVLSIGSMWSMKYDMINIRRYFGVPV